MHAEEFGRIGVCSQCVEAISPDGAPPVLVTPDGCLSVEQLERRFVAMAALAEQHALDALSSDDWHERALAPKLLDSSLKALRAALSIAKSRTDEHRVAAIIAEVKRLKANH